jgi:hypothetical protein
VPISAVPTTRYGTLTAAETVHSQANSTTVNLIDNFPQRRSP